MENRVYDLALRYVAPFVRKYARLEVVGENNLPKPGRGALLACNHSGSMWWDALCLASSLPDRQLKFIAHYWDANIAPIRKALEWVDSSFLDECDEHIDGECDVVKQLQAGYQMCIYPEESYHSFWHRYTLFQFSPHVVRYALEADVPIIPVSIIGAEEAAPTFLGLKKPSIPLHIPFHPPMIFPVKITIEFGEPIWVDQLAAEDPQTMADELRECIFSSISKYRNCKLSDEKYIHHKSWL